MGAMATDLKMLYKFHKKYFSFSSKKGALFMPKQEEIDAFAKNYEGSKTVAKMLRLFIIEFWNVDDVGKRPTRERMDEFLYTAYIVKKIR